MIFFSRCFIGIEQRYRLSELEIVYLVWAYKQLYILLYSNNKCIMVFTDHNAIYGIVKSINLNIISIDRINHRFTNVSVYLSVYPLNIYHIFNCLNLVLDAFSRLRTIKDNIIRTDNEVEPAFDTI